jgi:ParB-like chromosome segregation protein Spo0J
MEYTLQSRPLKVALSDIDLSPGPFCMSFHFSLERLKSSIDRFGVLNPPYLVKDSAFTVVAGYRRLLAAWELGWRDIGCRIVPDGLPPLDILLFNLHDNLCVRQFNPIEKSMVLTRLARYLTKEEIIRDYMPMLELPSTAHALELYMGLDDLDDAIRVSVAAGRLSMRVAGLMGASSMEDQRGITNLFSSLKWSFNRQWEATLWIMEIASREGRSIGEVVEDARITEVVKNDKMNGPQKVRAIVRVLREMRFPTLMEFERSFVRAVSDLALPSRVRVIPPPFFEGADYKLEIVFSEGKELMETLSRLRNTAGLEEITDFCKTKK